jgi:ABC-2 type transport system permease protein
VSSASARALIPATFLLAIAIPLGAHFPGVEGLALSALIVMAMAAGAACWGTMLALKFKTQGAAPLMQAGMFMLILTTTAYAPQELLTGWLYTVAKYNPVTQVVEAARQGYVGPITWAGTWPGLLALAGLIAGLATLALRGMRRMAV